MRGVYPQLIESISLLLQPIFILILILEFSTAIRHTLGFVDIF